MKDYSNIRGFNVHGDWGSNGTIEWLQFDAPRYREMIKIGKARFPGMNTVRIWLSYDAYMANKEKYLQSVKAAADILTEENLNIVPVYFNGWFGNPPFGGFVGENVQEPCWGFFISCLRDTVNVLKNTNVLMHDISNEPFNNAWLGTEARRRVTKFLIKMIEVLRAMDDKPITVGTQGYPHAKDLDEIAPLLDVISLHPYNTDNLPQAEFEKQFLEVLGYAKTFQKPYIITECIWGTPDADSRKSYLESELETYAKYNVGFICHALFTSPVADLYPVSECEGGENLLYMAFLDKDFNIRPHHDIFNRFAPKK
jgi:hypothetical protein